MLFYIKPTMTTHKNSNILSETWSSSLLDCGASKTVCGKEWLNQYISNFPQHQQQNIKYAPKQRCISFWRRKESDGYWERNIPCKNRGGAYQHSVRYAWQWYSITLLTIFNEKSRNENFRMILLTHSEKTSHWLPPPVATMPFLLHLQNKPSATSTEKIIQLSL